MQFKKWTGAAQNIWSVRKIGANLVCVVRFQVLIVVIMKMTAFWYVASCGLVEIYRHF